MGDPNLIWLFKKTRPMLISAAESIKKNKDRDSKYTSSQKNEAITDIVYKIIQNNSEFNKSRKFVDEEKK